MKNVFFEKFSKSIDIQRKHLEEPRTDHLICKIVMMCRPNSSKIILLFLFQEYFADVELTNCLNNALDVLQELASVERAILKIKLNKLCKKMQWPLFT